MAISRQGGLAPKRTCGRPLDAFQRPRSTFEMVEVIRRPIKEAKMGYRDDTSEDRNFLRGWLDHLRYMITNGWRFGENGRDVTRERYSDDLSRARYFWSVLRKRESN